MKKYLFAMLMAVCVLASCSNDDIEVNVVEQNKTTFTYSVETQSVYDKFNVTNSLKKNFLSGEAGDYHVGVFTYIYDEKGELAASDNSFAKTFGEIDTEFTLQDGKYTAVTVEMIVDKDNKFESEIFDIIGTDNLSTIEIAYKKDGDGNYQKSAMWYDGIGVKTTELIINESQSNVEVTPEPIGVILRARFTNFDKSDYSCLLVHTKNAPIGRYLDPKKNGDARFHYDNYNSGIYVDIRNYIYIPNGLNNLEGFDIYMIEDGDIECALASTTVEKDKSFHKWHHFAARNGLKDGNIYHGGLYYIGGAIHSGEDFSGGIFDTESEYNSWLKNAEKQYNPSFSLFTPYTTWGAKVSAVHNSMSAYTQTVGTSTTAEYLSDINQYKTEYRGMTAATGVQYYFTSSTTGLNWVDVFYDNNKHNVADIKKELDKKYILESSSEGNYIYTTVDMKTLIFLMPGSNFNSKYNEVAYFDMSDSQGSKNAAFDLATKAMRTAPAKIISPMATFAQKCELSKPFMMDKNNMKSQMISVKR